MYTTDAITKSLDGEGLFVWSRRILSPVPEIDSDGAVRPIWKLFIRVDSGQPTDLVVLKGVKQVAMLRSSRAAMSTGKSGIPIFLPDTGRLA